MNWIQRKIYLYNVTFGLYMLDWWERYLFNTLIIVLMWFIFYNGLKYGNDAWQRTTEFCKRCSTSKDYNQWLMAAALYVLMWAYHGISQLCIKH